MIHVKIQHANHFILRPGVKIPVIQHESAQLEIILEGKTILFEPGKKHELEAGSWVWIAPNAPHGWLTETTMRGLTFKFSLQAPSADRLSKITIHSMEREAWITFLLERAVQIWQTKIHSMQEAANHLLSGAYVLAKHRENLKAHLEPKWAELLKFLQQPSNPKISLVEMANRVHLSSSHFRKLFKNQFSKSPVQYQLECKMNWARDTLRYTSIPIKEVANQMGYSDLSSFSKAFTAHFSQRPTQARKGKHRRT